MADRWTDDDGEFDEVARAAWVERWSPTCPIGNPQRVRRCLGYREREPGRLQLRVAMGCAEGVCEVVFLETPETVYVRILLCYEADEEDEGRREYMNCPVHIYLDQPLGDRSVYDVQTEQEVPMFVPDW